MTDITKAKTIAIIDRVAFFFYAVMVFFLPIGEAFIEISFSFLFLCFLIKGVLEKPSWQKTKAFFSIKVNLALLIFYLAIGLSIFAAGPLWAKSLKAWFAKWGEMVFLFYFAQVFLNRQRITWLIALFLASGCLASVSGLYQWVYGVDFLRHEAIMNVQGRYEAVRSSFNHYNDFATYLVALVPLSFAAALRTRRPLFMVTLLLEAAFFIVILVLTASRAAWLGLATAVLCFVAVRRTARALKYFIAGVLLVVTAVASFPPGARWLWDFIERADAGRFAIWKAAFMMFFSSPFIGTGLGLFMKTVQRYGFEPLYAHNCYLQLLAETGLAGLASFLWFCAALIHSSLAYLGRQKDPLVAALFSAVCALYVLIFFDTQLYSVKLAAVFFLFLSFLASAVLKSSCRAEAQ